MKFGKVIRSLAGISPEKFNHIEYEVGQAFLELMESDQPEVLAFMESSKFYWDWWRNQFDALTREFIGVCGLEELRQCAPNYVLERFELYVRTIQISNTGMAGYVSVLQRANRRQSVNQNLLENEQITNEN